MLTYIGQKKYFLIFSTMLKKYIIVAITLIATGSSIAFAAINKFSDVTGTEWFAQGLDKNTQRGIITGYLDGTFKPDNKVSRAETSAITDRTINYMLANDLAYSFYEWANTQDPPQTLKIDNQDILISAPNAGGSSRSILADKGIENLAKLLSNKERQLGGEDLIFSCKNELKTAKIQLYTCGNLGKITTQNTEWTQF